MAEISEEILVKDSALEDGSVQEHSMVIDERITLGEAITRLQVLEMELLDAAPEQHVVIDLQQLCIVGGHLEAVEHHGQIDDARPVACVSPLDESQTRG